MTCPGSVSRPGNPDATSVLPPPWPTVRPDPEEARKRTWAWGGGNGGSAHSAPLSLSSVNTHCMLSLPGTGLGPTEASALLTVAF